MNAYQQFVLASLILVAGAIGQLSLPISGQASSNRLIAQRLPLPPSTPGTGGTRAGGSQNTPDAPGQPHILPQMENMALPRPPAAPPPNGTRSGGSLSGETTTCGEAQPLVALIPKENPVLTTADHPTLLIYVPYAAKDVARGELSILVGLEEMQSLYRHEFQLPATPGIVQVTLPPTAPALQPDTYYHWYFKLYCQGNATQRADQDVDGWMLRVASTTDRQQQIAAASPDIWYDSLAQLAEQRQANPQDGALQAQWERLLDSIDATELANQPIVGSVQLKD